MVLLPVNTFLNLLSGIILLPVSISTAMKINSSSKSHFAFTLVAFTFGYGVQNIIWFSINISAKKVYINDTELVY